MSEQIKRISTQRAIANYCIRCELYSYRPITSATKAKNREEYLATLTVEERILSLGFLIIITSAWLIVGTINTFEEMMGGLE